MRSIFMTCLLLVAGSTIAMAQCDKKVSLTSSKTQHWDDHGTLKHTDDEKVVVEFTKSDMTVSIDHDGNQQQLTGKVKSDTCDWKIPFKDGRSRFHVTLNNDNGESRDYTMTITGKDGKLSFTAESKDEPDDIIKLDIDKFEEKN
jgi:hypothetical protein